MCSRSSRCGRISSSTKRRTTSMIACCSSVHSYISSARHCACSPDAAGDEGEDETRGGRSTWRSTATHRPRRSPARRTARPRRGTGRRRATIKTTSAPDASKRLSPSRVVTTAFTAKRLTPGMNAQGVQWPSSSRAAKAKQAEPMSMQRDRDVARRDGEPLRDRVRGARPVGQHADQDADAREVAGDPVAHQSVEGLDEREVGRRRSARGPLHRRGGSSSDHCEPVQTRHWRAPEGSGYQPDGTGIALKLTALASHTNEGRGST